MLKKSVKLPVILVLGLASVFLSCSGKKVISNSFIEEEKLPKNIIRVDKLDLAKGDHALYKPIAPGKCVTGKPLTLKGREYKYGMGAQVRSELHINLNGEAEEFASLIGVDDEGGKNGVAVFEIYADGKLKFKSKTFKAGDEPEFIRVDLRGAKRLSLMSAQPEKFISNCYADWAGAIIAMKPDFTKAPETFKVADMTPMPIAPKYYNPKPKIHGPRVTGSSPGKPFLFKIPATGNAPLYFTVKNLPEGLTLDAKTGIISGAVKNAGDYKTKVYVQNSNGQDSRNFFIRCGDRKLAQTPPMGWNSWNSFALDIDDEKIRQTADNMISTNLASYGYQYIVIDDAWAKERDENGIIKPLEKFPDMKALSDYVHQQGLKLGIYSSPGPATCANYPGSYQHEDSDAKTFADWGMDYLKYDWCHYSKVLPNWSRPEMKKPYIIMRDALDKCGRDIVFSYCQYGMSNVWEWGAETGGNLWRTTGDLIDTWGWLADNVTRQRGLSKYAGPGGWNDPDMLVIGTVRCTKPAHPSLLTPNEQIYHVSLWAMLAAPFMIGCDLTQIDDFTLALLCNNEILEIDQDPLGNPGEILWTDGLREIWSRKLWDGTVAVGFFNRDVEEREISVSFSDIEISGRQNVRDVWTQKDLGEFRGSFSSPVPAHGAKLFKIGKPNSDDFELK